VIIFHRIYFLHYLSFKVYQSIYIGRYIPFKVYYLDKYFFYPRPVFLRTDIIRAHHSGNIDTHSPEFFYLLQLSVYNVVQPFYLSKVLFCGHLNTLLVSLSRITTLSTNSNPAKSIIHLKALIKRLALFSTSWSFLIIGFKAKYAVGSGSPLALYLGPLPAPIFTPP